MTNRLRTRLNSDALDDRIVPDASPVISVMPPAGTPEYLGYMLGMQSIPANLSGSNSQPTNAEPDSAPGDGPALAPALATSGGGTTLTGDPRYYTDPNGVSVLLTLDRVPPQGSTYFTGSGISTHNPCYDPPVTSPQSVATSPNPQGGVRDMLYRPGQDDTSIELDDVPFYDSQVDGRISLMVGPSGDEEIPSRFRIFWGEIRDGLARNGEGVLQAATELGQIGRDLGNTELSLGSQVTNQLFGAGVYSYDLHSGMFSGYDQAVKSSPPSGPGRYQSPQAAEIQFSAMRGAGTLGLYDLGSDGLEAWRTDDYSEFQHSTGAFGFGVALPYAPRVVTGVGRAAGPYLNPGNYRLNPNSLQSFPSVPLEYNGPTFTRPSGAGPVPVGPQGPTVVQSPPLTGPVTVTGPAAAGSPTADAGGRCCGRSTYDTGRGCYPSTWHF